jgi:hypothetical protein
VHGTSLQTPRGPSGIRHWAYLVTQVAAGAGDVSALVGQPITRRAKAARPQEHRGRRNEGNRMSRSTLLRCMNVIGPQRGRTFSARGPLGPWPSSNETFCPSRKSSNRTPSTLDMWKKMSLPGEVSMNPKPRSVRRLIVPSAMLCSFLSDVVGDPSSSRPTWQRGSKPYWERLPSSNRRSWLIERSLATASVQFRGRTPPRTASRGPFGRR